MNLVSVQCSNVTWSDPASDDSASESDPDERAKPGTWLILNGEVNKHNFSENVQDLNSADIMRTVWMGIVVDYPKSHRVTVQRAELVSNDDVKEWVVRKSKTLTLNTGTITGEPYVESTHTFKYVRQLVHCSLFTINCSKKREIWKFDPLNPTNQKLLEQWVQENHGNVNNLSLDKRFLVFTNTGKRVKKVTVQLNSFSI